MGYDVMDFTKMYNQAVSLIYIVIFNVSVRNFRLRDNQKIKARIKIFNLLSTTKVEITTVRFKIYEICRCQYLINILQIIRTMCSVNEEGDVVFETLNHVEP